MPSGTEEASGALVNAITINRPSRGSAGREVQPASADPMPTSKRAVRLRSSGVWMPRPQELPPSQPPSPSPPPPSSSPWLPTPPPPPQLLAEPPPLPPPRLEVRSATPGIAGHVITMLLDAGLMAAALRGQALAGRRRKSIRRSPEVEHVPEIEPAPDMESAPEVAAAAAAAQPPPQQLRWGGRIALPGTVAVLLALAAWRLVTFVLGEPSEFPSLLCPWLGYCRL